MDPAIFRQALTLTVIGIGTAFGLLVVMMIVVNAVRLLVKHVLERPAGNSSWVSRRFAARSDRRHSDKALAAIAAVSVLLSGKTSAAKP